MPDPITIADYTGATVDGTGSFDVMMRSVKAHVSAEYNNGRITGAEYANVYLGALQSTMDRALDFLITRDKLNLEIGLLALQTTKLTIEKDIAAQQLLQMEQEVLKSAVLVTLTEAQVTQMGLQNSQIEEQSLLIAAQTAKATNEVLQLTAQTAQVVEQTALIAEQRLKVSDEIEAINAQTALTQSQTTVSDKQALKLAADTLLTTSQKAVSDQQTLKLTQDTINAVSENTVLIAQQCKLTAEFDLISEQVNKTTAEKELLAQKTVTETAQTNAVGTSTDSVLGKQKALYTAQTASFARNDEQKTAKLLIDSWNARRLTDDATLADSVNGLLDANVGRAVTKLLTGIDA